ncbi:glycolate oxidase subunit GlcD [Caballeronia sordidicola]|uniref:Glycolate oxidase subunit GlcD n=1 Tax=Caballeronia sordidicola TaxID=196367 RepID=A0A158FSC5_CABSO|nr:FAD-binding oxidoreductase [Caballeronia sordidicola]SAL22705.1 glycolate oxidase subunit GlcD [Caballeronia sordidicola]
MSGPARPPGMSESDFQRALGEFAAVVGRAAVLSGEGAAQPYLDPFDPFPPGDTRAHEASAVVLVADIEQLRAVLNVANRYGVPLWSVSTGRNFAYGGAAPRLKGCVVLDMQRMNRVLEINETLGFALVEPGVSYYDLYRELKARDSKLWLDPPAAGWGSVMGNTLERGFGTTPYGDHASAQCGMEVMLANGDLVRTGMGAMSGSREWQVFKPGFGPSYDAMFMQSNFGIVTKIGVWLMPRPAGYLLCRYMFRHDADLENIVETLRPLKLDETIQSNAVIESAVRWAAGVSTRKQWYDGPGAMPDALIDKMARALGIGRWNLRFCLYGPERLVKARRDVIHERFSRIADAQLIELPYIDSSVEPKGGGDRSQVGIPNLDAFNLLNWRGGSGAHIDFSPVCPPVGHDAVQQVRMVRDRAAQYGFDYYGGFTVGARSMHHIFAAIFNRDDAGQTTGARNLLETLINDFGAAGYGQYRTHLEYMDLAASQYDFNNHALMRLSETIKHALDPNGVLSPGKQGIWPGKNGGRAQ